jgi:hypothetical protein
MRIRIVLVLLPLLLSLSTFAAGQATHTVSLSWTAPAIPPADLLPPVAQPVSLTYIVYRGTVTGGPYAQVGTSVTTSYTDNSLTAGMDSSTLYYVVTAAVINSVGTSLPSANSNETAAVIPGTAPGTTAPPAPSGLSNVVH